MVSLVSLAQRVPHAEALHLACPEITHIAPIYISLAKANHMFMPNFKREGKVQSTMSLEKTTGVFVNDLNERPRTYLLWPI